MRLFPASVDMTVFGWALTEKQWQICADHNKRTGSGKNKNKSRSVRDDNKEQATATATAYSTAMARARARAKTVWAVLPPAVRFAVRA
jgi:hypothetical protein